MKRIMIGLTVCLGMLAVPMTSMASLGRVEAAPYQTNKSVKPAKKSVKAVKRGAGAKAPKSVRTKTASRSSNSFKGGELPKSASCSKRSKVGLFAQTAFTPDVNSIIKKSLDQHGIN